MQLIYFCRFCLKNIMVTDKFGLLVAVLPAFGPRVGLGAVSK